MKVVIKETVITKTLLKSMFFIQADLEVACLYFVVTGIHITEIRYFLFYCFSLNLYSIVRENCTYFILNLRNIK
jgi:hypothetical protein